MNAKEIAHKIFYSPATNGKAEGSISEGERMIKDYAKAKLEEAAERASIKLHSWKSPNNWSMIRTKKAEYSINDGTFVSVDKQSITETPLD